MRKLILSAMLLGLAGIIKINAAPVTMTVVVKQDKVAVRPDDLPEAVKNALSSDAYSGWQVTSAFLVTREDNSQYFEINAKKAEQTTVINMDKYGKKVD
ncbi:hypothetical protein [Dyadobacter sp. CY326]|uniref:hypothetical protein n=1 Tax=Dyadobacter sp. CY326 TaxID=2907300 RepID=UPI001F28CCA1|nr:hypothetical protein [Dyadobacter sp. CY326]MCE7066210.1 hypothetical protein [Dyadobacter sp. CY326]